ncbi:hypothetical protein HY993_03755 [Candidatus Micrarchaeota archaeon]|nr:hypothetical protein [Candidatus Micrarchaeota archaeon]
MVCPHTCYGCVDVRKMMTPTVANLHNNPELIDKAFDLLEIHEPKTSADKWRIQVSGSTTDPIMTSDETLERIFERSAGHKLIVHTASLHEPNFRRMFEKYLDSSHRKSGGGAVFVLSLNAPVYAHPEESTVERNAAFYAAQFGHHTFKREYHAMLENIDWLKNRLAKENLEPEKLTLIAKQIFFLEQDLNPNLFGTHLKGSIKTTKEAISFWDGIAHGYHLGPAYFRGIKNRVPRQEEFEAWISRLRTSLEKSNLGIDVSYRRFTAKPQETKQAGVLRYQFTLGKNGFFVPCDYTEVPLPNLPRVDDPSLTKKQVEDAYEGTNYRKEPCRSCLHKNCTHDYYQKPGKEK